MSNVDRAKEDPKGQLWDVIEDVTAVMLGSPVASQHMQPMAPLLARDEEAIWFFTSTDTDLAKAVERQAGAVHMCVIGKDHAYHACLRGTLQRNHSQQHIDRFWPPMAAAWFGDKDDPSLTMLCFKPEHAGIWASTDSSLKFGWEMAKANMGDSEPDVGLHTEINF